MTALIEPCVRCGRYLLIVFWMTILAPLIALAAPYADYVVDARTGQVLHQTNASTRLHPASLTKMMTLYITFQAIERGEISLDSRVTVSKHAASQPPSRLGLKPGQKIALRYLIRAAAIKSANDAATAIGEAVSGSEAAFARRMTATAKALGMTKTTFRNANGLTADGHLSTAHDMTMLGRHLFYDFPQYYGLFSRRTADAGIAKVASTNARFLNSYKGADGIKTGYTGPAGFNLVASAQRGNKRIIATVFGGTSTAQRNARVAELLDVGFGKAPNRVAEQKPDAPLYVQDAPAEPSQDDVAEAVAGSVTIEPGAVAKTIRVKGAINKSPRPLARPAPDAPEAPATLLAEAPAATPDAIPAEDPAAAVLMAMQSDIDAVLAEAATTPGFEQLTAPQPETAALAAAAAADATESTVEPGSEQDSALALAANEPATDALDAARPDVAEGTAITGPAVANLRPRAAPRPDAAAPEALLAEAVAQPSPVPAAEAQADGATAATDAPGQMAFVAAGAMMTPLPPAPATPAEAPAQKTIRPEPSPATAGTLADQVVIADLAPADAAPEVQPEVVTRISTSGGHQWGINVGNFPSRYNAERQLLQVALLETNTLGESLRKVVGRKGGFDANFLGLSQEAAELACRRLAARGANCLVIGPG